MKNFYSIVFPINLLGFYPLVCATLLLTGANEFEMHRPVCGNLFIAFKNDTANTTAIVLVNDNATDQAIKLSGANLPSQFNKYITSANDDYGVVKSTDALLLPANSVVTLYKKN